MAEKETTQKNKTVVAAPAATQSPRASKAPAPAALPITAPKPKTIVPTPVAARRGNV